MKTLGIKIVTPDKMFLNDKADFIVVPGVSGELGVLPGHMRLLAQLVPGTVRLMVQGTVRSFAVSGGFAFISPDAVKVFTTMARNA